MLEGKRVGRNDADIELMNKILKKLKKIKGGSIFIKGQGQDPKGQQLLVHLALATQEKKQKRE